MGVKVEFQAQATHTIKVQTKQFVTRKADEFQVTMEKNHMDCLLDTPHSNGQ